MISKKAMMDFVERIRYAFDDDDDPDSDSVSGKEFGLAFSGWNDDGGIGGYVDAILQKGQDGDVEDMICFFLFLETFFPDFYQVKMEISLYSVLINMAMLAGLWSWITLNDIFSVLLFQSLVK